jgi:hypothetical protein
MKEVSPSGKNVLSNPTEPNSQVANPFASKLRKTGLLNSYLKKDGTILSGTTKQDQPNEAEQKSSNDSFKASYSFSNKSDLERLQGKSKVSILKQAFDVADDKKEKEKGPRERFQSVDNTRSTRTYSELKGRSANGSRTQGNSQENLTQAEEKALDFDQHKSVTLLDTLKQSRELRDLDSSSKCTDLEEVASEAKNGIQNVSTSHEKALVVEPTNSLISCHNEKNHNAQLETLTKKKALPLLQPVEVAINLMHYVYSQCFQTNLLPGKEPRSFALSHQLGLQRL